MSDPSFSKKGLRTFFLDVRKKMSEKQVERKSSDIINRILHSAEFSEAENIHTYVAIKDKNEVDTIPFIKECFIRNKSVAVPKIVGDGLMEHILLSSLDDLELNHWGVPEPGEGQNIPVKKIDLVIVPMIAGDRFKNRLGYGKGFYDRFLLNCPAVKMGLLFDCQMYDKKLPVESFDIPLDILITESKRID